MAVKGYICIIYMHQLRPWHAAADVPGLFHDTPAPRAAGVFAMADALALQRIQNRATSTQV